MLFLLYGVDQDVVQFKVTMDYVVLVKIVKCKQELFDYYLYLALREGSIPLH